MNWPLVLPLSCICLLAQCSVVEYNLCMEYMDDLVHSSKLVQSIIGRHEKRRLKTGRGQDGRKYTFDVGKGTIDGVVLCRLYSTVAEFFERFNDKKYAFLLVLRSLEFQDKNVYMFLELLVYNILKRSNFRFEAVSKIPKKYKLESVGFQNTALYQFIFDQSGLNYNDKRQKFIEHYEKVRHINKRWYRTLLRREELDKDDTASQITTEISCFLKNAGVLKHTTETTYNVVAELLSNTEHNDGDCLLDIDICGEYLNLSFINLFGGRMFDKLSMLHKSNNLTAGARDTINKALIHHKNHFCNVYTEDDFYLVSAFQESVTTKSGLAGGTGLTKVINVIAEEAESAFSYVLSGNNVLLFQKGFLGDGSGTVGFNESNDYYNDIPDKRILNRCSLYIPGVVFNLVFKFEVS